MRITAVCLSRVVAEKYLRPLHRQAQKLMEDAIVDLWLEYANLERRLLQWKQVITKTPPPTLDPPYLPLKELCDGVAIDGEC